MPKKDPFEDLPDEWKSAADAMANEEIISDVSKVAVADYALNLAKDLDEDLKRAREEASAAGAVYREGAKMNKLKIAYHISLLKGRGAPIAAVLDQLAPKSRAKVEKVAGVKA